MDIHGSASAWLSVKAAPAADSASALVHSLMDPLWRGESATLALDLTSTVIPFFNTTVLNWVYRMELSRTRKSDQ